MGKISGGIGNAMRLAQGGHVSIENSVRLNLYSYLLSLML